MIGFGGLCARRNTLGLAFAAGFGRWRRGLTITKPRAFDSWRRFVVNGQGTGLFGSRVHVEGQVDLDGEHGVDRSRGTGSGFVHEMKPASGGLSTRQRASEISPIKGSLASVQGNKQR